MKKYELLVDDTIIFCGRKLFRIKALISFGSVETGELGGYIGKEENLSQEGDAWVSGNAQVFGDAWVCGNARVSGNAEVQSLKDYIVFKNNWSSGRYFTYTKSNKMWRVGCFYGTGKELIGKAYKDGENIGKHYEAYVKFVEQLEVLEADNDPK